MLDKNTLEIIKEFKSAADALRYINIEPKSGSSLISKACRTNQNAYGYKWKLKENYKQKQEE